MKRRVRARQRGITLIELLVASLLLSIGLMALVNLWAFAFTVSQKSDRTAIAYNLGRQAMETAKASGFTSAAEGNTTVYYDANEGGKASTQAANHRYRVVTYVQSDKVSSGSSGSAGAVPANDALRTVTVTVTALDTSTTAYQSTTYLAKAGI